jgi:sulfate adenylyltransferase
MTTRARQEATSRATPIRVRPLLVDDERRADLRSEAVRLPSFDLDLRQICDLELLLNGAFSPLNGYLGRPDYEAVLERQRLADGTLWPIPITLDVPRDFAGALSEGDRVALRHPEGMILAVLTVTNRWEPDLRTEAAAVYGTTDVQHPGVSRLLHRADAVYLGGSLEGLELPQHHTFRHLRHTPLELRAVFEKLGWPRVVALQTRNPMHRAHVELTLRAAASCEAHLLIHPVAGWTHPGDLDDVPRVRCYEAALQHMPAGLAMLSLLPLSMRMAGPREALWHAIIRRNHGCTHFIVGRDHAGPRDAGGGSFYRPYEARDLAMRHAAEIGIVVVPFDELVYLESQGRYVPSSQVPDGQRALTLSGTELRRRLREGEEIPSWFSYPEIIRELRRTYPPRSRQGYTVFFTGLSAAGKSTIAAILAAKLRELDDRPVTLLDGDIVRKNLSSELGFSREHRDLNIRRIAFVAGEITKNRGVAICAPIAPYRLARREARDHIRQHGGFIEVYVSTQLPVCERRDRKGLYARARAGLIEDFTGITDPYEPPERAEIVLDTAELTAEEAARRIATHLQKEGYLGPSPHGDGAGETS